MKNKYLKISLIITATLIAFSSCKNDEVPIPPTYVYPTSNETNGKTTAIFNPNVTYGSMSDQDGNIYKTVTIGTQTWMAENLRSIKYNDGTLIPNVIENEQWNNLTSGAYCNFENTTNIDSIATLGRLYNWYTTKTGKLAPKGWHVPTDVEWQTLIDYLDGNSIAGGKMKEIGLTHWSSPNTAATNESGFTGLPSSYRYNGAFYILGFISDFWSATEHDLTPTNAWFFNLDTDVDNTSKLYISKQSGFSVRCIKD